MSQKTSKKSKPLLPLPDDQAYDDSNPPKESSYILPKSTKQTIDPSERTDTPTQKTTSDPGQKEAIELIRAKISKLYQQSPPTETEVVEAEQPIHHSKHQVHLKQLHSRGLSAEDLDAAWKDYYSGLSPEEKYEVWHEYYQNSNRYTSFLGQGQTEKIADEVNDKHHIGPIRFGHKSPKYTKDEKDGLIITDPSDVQVRPKRRRRRAKLTIRQHLQSALVGILVGAVFLFFYMFTFFNERFIAPFIQPSRAVASTQIIIEPNASVNPDPKVIIPKLNVEAPVVYGVPFISSGETEAEFEDRMQNALKDGVVHYPSSQNPGQSGQGYRTNTVIVGHSTNNVFNEGKYKFAFLRLRDLEIGDTFMLNYAGVQYVYKIYEKRVVAPTEVSVLGQASRTNSATLITCDPPGFNTNRLIIVGEQISPNPDTNTYVPEPIPTDTTPSIVPGNPKSLWQRIWDFVF